MKSLDQLQEMLNTAFASIQYPEKPAGLFDPIAYTMAQGGKRLRPMMVLLACDTWSEEPERAINAAIGIELFHNFTLIHDDIMDDAPLRRGKETVYKKWDANTAILSGDAMFALATEYMARVQSERTPDIIRLFAKTAREVCEGQQFDMEFETSEKIGLCDYLEMIRLKTAVLLACSLETGALIGGAEPDEAKILYDFGIQLGLCFQIKDDYLDLFGDEQLFGKKTGGDIRARKKTYLFLKSMELAGKDTREELSSLYHKNSGKEEEIHRRIVDIYLDLQIREIAQDEMERLFKHSIEILNTLKIDVGKKQRLSVFANNLLNRIH
jgi:geranylgeranyl diphosphate synthase type II